MMENIFLHDYAPTCLRATPQQKTDSHNTAAHYVCVSQAALIRVEGSLFFPFLDACIISHIKFLLGDS